MGSLGRAEKLLIAAAAVFVCAAAGFRLWGAAGPEPSPREETEAAAPSPAGAGRVDLNRASRAELEALPGIGPRLAERIIAHRERYGPFRSAADIVDVEGVGQALYDALRDCIYASTEGDYENTGG